MIDNTKEYILCAAWKRIKPKTNEAYWSGKNDINMIEIGYRHHDIYQRFPEQMASGPKAQGFYTSKGKYVDRHEGMRIAYECGQVSEYIALDKSYLSIQLSINGSTEPTIDNEKFNQLFSEDLY